MADFLEFIDTGAQGEHRGTVVWMHGLGADGHDFEPVVDMLGLPANAGIRFILPHAPMQPVTINNGYVMRAWYDVLSMEIERRADIGGVQRSVQAVLSLTRSVVPQQPDHPVVFAGFSQGGVIALHAALQAQSMRVAGVIALSTYFPSVPESDLKKLEGLPVFWGHGQFDPVVPLELGRTARDALAAAGATVEGAVYPIDHSVNLEEIAAIGVWLRRRFDL